MSEQSMNRRSGSDWARIEAMRDEEIDVSDIPPLSDAFFERAKLWKAGRPVAVTLDVDQDILDWFKAQGDDFPRRMNAALRIYAEAHRQS